ncbi:hypothetical protein SLEP1_g17120 [Rubroshorea leprosula]|uniref:Protein kinase domain-containing protein n=1 Tax=Rubroshorea leprosula TaxID=152421 RepID=A0AAV5IT88_9ROSI|nr:hypothetical protein SLEP1_g17120 [Rubroshorea leprosula]
MIVMISKMIVHALASDAARPPSPSTSKIMLLWLQIPRTPRKLTSKVIQLMKLRHRLPCLNGWSESETAKQVKVSQGIHAALMLAALIPRLVVDLVAIACQGSPEIPISREDAKMLMSARTREVFHAKVLVGIPLGITRATARLACVVTVKLAAKDSDQHHCNSLFLGEGGFGSVYKGVSGDSILVAVKKAKDVDKARMNQEFQHEISVVSQVNHKNVVKLLVDTSDLLDDHYTAKVSDFGASALISPNQTGIGSKIQGTFGYLDPEYLMTGNLTARSDVYSFGVVLVELLTGEQPTSHSRDGERRNIIQYFISSVEDNWIIQVPNFEPADDGEMVEVEAVAKLVKRCVNGSSLKRPTMKVVVEELSRLKKLNDNLWAQQGNEEIECLLGESSLHTSYEFSNINMDQMDTYTVRTTFDFEQGSTVGI